MESIFVTAGANVLRLLSIDDARLHRLEGRSQQPHVGTICCTNIGHLLPPFALFPPRALALTCCRSGESGIDPHHRHVQITTLNVAKVGCCLEPTCRKTNVKTA